MEKYYVFGHQNPDTDSVTAAINLANLKRKLGVNAEERVLGDINKETKYVLDYFKVKEPRYLNDVKIKIKDIEYRKNCFLTSDKSIEQVYQYMQKKNTTGVPIVNRNKELLGLITAKDILNKVFFLNDSTLNTSYDNLIRTIKGEEVLRASNEINGKVIAAAFNHETFENNIILTNEDIVITGDRHSIIEYALVSKVNLLILVGNASLSKEHTRLAKKNKVNVIKTKLNTFEVSRVILYSNYISKILNKEAEHVLHEKDYYDTFLAQSELLKIDNYPVVDKNNKCLGLLRKSEISNPNKKKVILVDHNEMDQSATGLEEAEITEIVDHHKIGKISTNSPINFRNMIVGSSNTIIYFLYKENGIKITKQTAGLMLAGILSDTINFKSPTTTETDKKVAKELNKIAKIKIDKFALNMFKAGTSLEGMSIDDVLNVDSKTFRVGTTSFTISQMLTLNYEEILKSKDEYLSEIEKIKDLTNVNHYLFVITDIMNNGSYFIYDEDSEELIKNAFHLKKIEEGVFVENIISRKKQIVPSIINILEK